VVAKRVPFSVSFLCAEAALSGATLIGAPGAGKQIVIERVETSVIVTGGSGNVNIQAYYDIDATVSPVLPLDLPLIFNHNLNQVASNFVSDFTGLVAPFFGGTVRSHRNTYYALGTSAGDADLVARAAVTNKAVKISIVGASSTLTASVVVHGHVLTLDTV
jgi:hypothetical protein